MISCPHVLISGADLSESFLVFVFYVAEKFEPSHLLSIADRLVNGMSPGRI